VFTEEDIANIPTCPDVATQAITTVTVMPEQVAKLCSCLKVNKASGVDCIATRILSELSEEIKEPLSQIVQQSLDSHDIPGDWRSANVTPIYKKGPRNKTCNYRPVSLTSVPGKAFETIIRSSIIDHLDRGSYISDTQHSFMSGRSCLSNLFGTFWRM
jgi:hypothetical protein